MSDKFRDFPFKQIREKVKGDKEYEEHGDWLVQDSGLLVNEDDPDKAINAQFEGLYPEEFEDSKQYLESRLTSKKGEVILLELGGRASKLSTEFSPGFLKRSSGSVLHDNRTEDQKAKDAERGHEVLEANLFSSKGKKIIKHWLHGEKADILLERMEGGIDNDFPSDLGFMSSVFNQWYDLVAEGGIMLVQTPPFDDSSLEQAEKWLNNLRQKNLTIEYKRREHGYHDKEKGAYFMNHRLYIILEKHKGAPESLLE